MKRSRLLPTLIAMLAVAVLAPASLAGEEPDPPFCARTAQNALRACEHDVFEEYWIDAGNCVNESTIRGRRDCRDEARADRDEARGECADQNEARLDICDALGGDRYHPDFDPADFEHPDSITVPNPFQSLTAGKISVVRSGDEGEELVIIVVTNDVKWIDGVPCRVVVDAEIEVGEEEGAVDYEPLEVTDDWFAQHVNGDVWYCGELSRNFEDGELVDLDGSFQAGVEGAQAGLLIPANPVPGQIYRQEFALGEAEDVAEVTSIAGSPVAEVDGFECNGACLQTRDFSPFDPDEEEHKFYIAGVGFVLAEKYSDGMLEDEREELICTGDSLDVLFEEACGIENPADLLDELCDLSDAFCPDDDE